jgi:hypothetical protein
MLVCVVLTLICCHCVNAGAVHAHFGHLYMDHTNVTGNTALRHGGGLYMGTRADVNADAHVQMSMVMLQSPRPSGTFIGPSQWDRTLYLTNCNLTMNKADSNGGTCQVA